MTEDKGKHEAMEPLLARLLSHVEAAANFILHERKHFTERRLERKGFNDLVSYVDLGAEDMLSTACREILPGSGLMREEGDDLPGDGSYRWIIDPLDGTTNFVHDIPAYCISVALERDGEVVLGVVWDVPHRVAYTAVRGVGAWQNGIPMQVSDRSTLEQALVGFGFPYDINGSKGDYMAVIHRFAREARGLRRCGAAALDLAWVAAGKLDAFFEIGLKPWDVAAGALLVREAGGQVSDFSGGEDYLFGREIAVSNAVLHPAILQRIQSEY